jgi:predicted nuclease of predicted toxin-antitoxin system
LKIAANENISRTTIYFLRKRGHDVLSIKEDMRGAEDEMILARAQAESRIVLTNDKDFGELAFRRRLPAACGVILLRLTGTNPESTNQRILEALDARADWAGHFALITNRQIKLRPIR